MSRCLDVVGESFKQRLTDQVRAGDQGRSRIGVVHVHHMQAGTWVDGLAKRGRAPKSVLELVHDDWVWFEFTSATRGRDYSVAHADRSGLKKSKVTLRRQEERPKRALRRFIDLFLEGPGKTRDVLLQDEPLRDPAAPAKSLAPIEEVSPISHDGDAPGISFVPLKVSAQALYRCYPVPGIVQ